MARAPSSPANPDKKVAHQLDVLIIGSGPAGVSTALHLVQADPGWAGRILVLEKEHHPRPKLCGGGVTYYGLNILLNLGFPYPLPVPHVVVDDIQLVYGSRTVHVHGRPVLIITNRAELDAYLAEEARRRGVIIQEGEAVLAITRQDGWMVAETEHAVYRARVIVAGDGSKGVGRRYIQKPKGAPRVARALEVVSPAAETAPQFTGRYAVFDFSPVKEHLQGYAWDFPTRVKGRACYNRGVFDARFAAKKTRARLPDLLQQALEKFQGPSGSQKPAGHPIHWFSPAGVFSKPGFLLVGDAAGADPLLGEGIAPAFGYGQVAASQIIDGFEKQDFSFRSYKRRILLSELGFYLLVHWYIAWWSYHLCHLPWFMHTLWSGLRIAAAILPKPGLNRKARPDAKGSTARSAR
jgi:menaquinone-9 beta-reductase